LFVILFIIGNPLFSLFVMSTWQPTSQGLSDLLQLLKEAINPTDSQAVQQVIKNKKKTKKVGPKSKKRH
jgi:hypothetical protein